ncbi:MAG: fumarylacetoacetate hydrolase family protein [Candidatus Acidiferrales bacterium]|jgi:2,4-didehydro-3-deoxy-L-rhamnonate hydrolase
MKLIRFGSSGKEKPGLILPDGTRVDASGFGSDYDESFFENSGLTALRKWFEKHGSAAPRIDPSTRLGPPISRPSKIVCIGTNYRQHALESGLEIPKEPVIFFKSTSSLAGPNDNVVIPRDAEKLDWEVELAFVVGKKASYVPKAHAFDYVAGYVLHNDYSERSFQLERGGQWVKGKSADTFAPLGPFLATRDEIQDPSNLKMWLTVNGETRQGGSTSDMIFDVSTILSYVSDFMTLLPGDVISTGTPAGVGLGMRPPKYLKAGDVVELGIDSLGESRQRIVAWKP